MKLLQNCLYISDKEFILLLNILYILEVHLTKHLTTSLPSFIEKVALFRMDELGCPDN